MRKKTKRRIAGLRTGYLKAGYLSRWHLLQPEVSDGPDSLSLSPHPPIQQFSSATIEPPPKLSRPKEMQYAAEASSGSQQRHPHLHRRGHSIRPRVIGNERELHATGLYGLSVVSRIESGAGCIVLTRQARMMKHDDSIQQVLSEFTLEVLASLLPRPKSNVAEVNSLRLIKPFEAINERASLNCYASSVVGHAWIRGEHLWSHCNPQTNDITVCPTAPNAQIFSRGRSSPRLSIHFHFGVVRPTRDPQENRELRRLRRRDGEVDSTIPRIVCLLSYFQAGAIFQMPVELRILIQMHVDSVTTGAVKISRQR